MNGNQFVIITRFKMNSCHSWLEWTGFYICFSWINQICNWDAYECPWMYDNHVIVFWIHQHTHTIIPSPPPLSNKELDKYYFVFVMPSFVLCTTKMIPFEIFTSVWWYQSLIVNRVFQKITDWVLAIYISSNAHTL